MPSLTEYAAIFHPAEAMGLDYQNQVLAALKKMADLPPPAYPECPHCGVVMTHIVVRLEARTLTQFRYEYDGKGERFVASHMRQPKAIANGTLPETAVAACPACDTPLPGFVPEVGHKELPDFPIPVSYLVELEL